MASALDCAVGIVHLAVMGPGAVCVSCIHSVMPLASDGTLTLTTQTVDGAGVAVGVGVALPGGGAGNGTNGVTQTCPRPPRAPASRSSVTKSPPLLGST